MGILSRCSEVPRGSQECLMGLLGHQKMYIHQILQQALKFLKSPKKQKSQLLEYLNGYLQGYSIGALGCPEVPRGVNCGPVGQKKIMHFVCLFCIRVARNEQYYRILWQQSQTTLISLSLIEVAVFAKNPSVGKKDFWDFQIPSIQLLIQCPSRHKNKQFIEFNIH